MASITLDTNGTLAKDGGRTLMHFYALLWSTKDRAWGTDGRYSHLAFYLILLTSQTPDHLNNVNAEVCIISHHVQRSKALFFSMIIKKSVLTEVYIILTSTTYIYLKNI